MSSKHPLSDEDKAAFQAAMDGSTSWDDDAESPPSQAESPAKHWINLDHLAESDWVSAECVIQFARSGVAAKQLKQLAAGELKIDQTMDFHGHTLDDLYNKLCPGIEQACQMGKRVLLIIPGKGCLSAQRPALLKNYLNQSLRHNPNVLAFHSAKPADGGSGAIYVLLKKRGTHV
jgi:DNA-nicking Smr family endonuclease